MKYAVVNIMTGGTVCKGASMQLAAGAWHPGHWLSWAETIDEAVDLAKEQARRLREGGYEPLSLQ